MMMRNAAILGVFVLASSARAAEIRTTTDRLEDTVVSIATQAGRLVVSTTGGKTIALENVKEIRFSERGTTRLRDVHLWLLAGDELNGTVGDEVKAGDSFELSTVSLGRLEVPLDAVGAMVFDVPAEREERFARKQLGWLLDGTAARPANDSFSLLEGGGCTGTVERFSREGLSFEDLKKNKFPAFPIKRLETLVFGAKGGKPVEKKALGLRALLRLVDGSTVVGPVQRLEGGKLTIDHPLGKKGALTVELSQVLSLEVLGGSFTYLSDLTPAAVDETFPEGFGRDADLFGWKRDREVLGKAPLRLAGRTYKKGLGVHSRSSLTFALGGSYRLLRAVVGLDDTTRFESPEADPSVTFRVIVDGKVVKELKKARGEAPDDLSLSVEGAKELTLVADCGDYLHILGRADWADAHLVK